MSIHSLQAITAAFFDLVAHTYNLDPTTIADSGITLQLLDASQAQHGDLATNAAMMLARQLKQNPRLIADTLVQRLASAQSDDQSPLSLIQQAAVAGPGFINITLTPSAWAHFAEQLATNAAAFVQREHATPTHSYLLEFVSANPTGPLHLGHGRNAIIGDVLKRVLTFCGHQVATEFYINDAGSQMAKLGTSLKIRCQQAVGQEVALPEDGYHGDYMVDLARECIATHGETIVDSDVAFFTSFAQERMLATQQKDLADYGVTFDAWFSEKTLHESGAIDNALATLTERGYLYEEDNALWFKATEFGDDKDRVIRKKDGDLTYIAADIAYHINKFERGAQTLINILGQDHHGYVQRLKGTMSALGYNADDLAVILYQLVSIKKGSMPVRMSKRAGTFTSLRDVIDIVGVDAARFFFLHKKAEAHLELDIEVALKKSQDNPVFYLQYAYVRTKSLQAKATEAGIKEIDQVDFDGFIFTPEECNVLRKALGLNQTLRSIESSFATHQMAQYALDMAQAFHSFYTNNKIVDADDMKTSQRRLALVRVVQEVLGLTHELLGLRKQERM